MFGRSLRTPSPRSTAARVAIAAGVVLIVALVIGEVVHQVLNASPKVGRRADATWSSAMGPILTSSSTVTPALASLEQPIGSTRVAFETALEVIEQTTTADEADYADLGIPAPSSSLGAEATRVLGDRASAARSLAQMVALATGPGHDASGAAEACRVAMRAIGSSDAAQHSLIGALSHLRGVSAPSVSTWGERGVALGSSGCTHLASVLAGDTSLESRRAIQILAVSISPTPVSISGLPSPSAASTTSSTTSTTTSTTTTTTLFGTPLGASGASGAVGVAPTGPFGPSGAGTTSPTTTTTLPVTTTTLQIPPPGARSVLPPTRSISVTVIVTNSGDSAISGAVLRTQLLAGAGQPSPARAVNLGSLAAGSSAYKVLGPLPLRGINGTVTLLVSVSGPGVRGASDRITLVTNS